MSLARAFTTVRRNKPTEDGKPATYIGRAASQRQPNAKPIERAQISLPVALLSTTNMLSYEAPDIEGTIRIANTIREVPASRSVSGNSSSDESDRYDRSDRSSIGGRSLSQDTDTTSVDGGESPIIPEPNHLSSYFKSSQTPLHARTESTASSQPSPIIPQRAPSHSIKAHVLSHKQSVKRVANPLSPKRDTFNRLSEISCTSSAPSTHPFGKELEQLNEAAEEFGSAVRDAEANADTQVMSQKNLSFFCAADYMKELSGLYSTAFAEDAATYQAVAWI